MTHNGEVTHNVVCDRPPDLVDGQKGQLSPPPADLIRLWSRPWSHVSDLWGRYWIIPLLPAAYTVVMFAIGDLRPEHIAISIASAALGFGTESTTALFVSLLPGLLLLWGSDAIRYLRPIFVTHNRILGCSMRRAELMWFSVSPNQTLQDYFAVHHSSFVDVMAAIPYGSFWIIIVGYACWLYRTDKRRLSHYLWALLLAQTIAFVIWLAFPAAPPWYIRSHGCVIDDSTVPNAAALLRVDYLFGIHYFQDFYSRATTTFGALPSMHCAFPMVGLLTAWRAIGWKTRPLHLLFAGSMIFASVYLDHHWLFDGLLGWLISAVSVVVVGAILSGRIRTSGLLPHGLRRSATPFGVAIKSQAMPTVESGVSGPMTSARNWRQRRRTFRPPGRSPC